MGSASSRKSSIRNASSGSTEARSFGAISSPASAGTIAAAGSPGLPTTASRRSGGFTWPMPKGWPGGAEAARPVNLDGCADSVHAERQTGRAPLRAQRQLDIGLRVAGYPGLAGADLLHAAKAAGRHVAADGA